MGSLVSPFNLVIKQFVEEQLGRKVYEDSTVDNTVVEYDGCIVQLRADVSQADSKFQVSICCPDLNSDCKEQLSSALAAVLGILAPIASSNPIQKDGYQISLAFSASSLLKMPDEERNTWLDKLSCCRMIAASAGIRCSKILHIIPNCLDTDVNTPTCSERIHCWEWGQNLLNSESDT